MIRRHQNPLFGKMVVLFIIPALGMILGAAGPTPAQGQASVKEVDRTSGSYYFGRYGCGACHGGDGKGTVIGTPIVGRPTGPFTREQIIKQVRTPMAQMPAFPPERLSDEKLGKIVARIATLENQASGMTSQASQAPEKAAQVQSTPLPPAPQVAPADPKTYEMKEYPSSCGAGHSISVAPDGRVWYSGIQKHNLVVFDPKTEKFQCWDVPTEKGRPHGIKVDPDGFVWVTITGLPQNKVTMFDPKTELFVDYLMPFMPQKFMYPHTVVFDKAKNPVFSFEYGDAIGRIVRATGRLQVWEVPTPRARPYGIQVDRNGTIWAVEFLGNKIVQVNPRKGTLKEYSHPRIADDPGLRRMAIDSRGRIWFGEHEFGSVGMFDPRTRRWKSWRAPANGGSPINIYSFNVDKNDVVWFSHFGGNYIGRFNPRTQKFSVYPHLSKSINCRLMDFAKDGTLWCMGSGTPNLVHLKVNR